MGGGGTRWLGPSDADKLRARLRQAESNTESDLFDAAVEKAIGEKLAEFNDRDSDQIGQILNDVATELGDEFELSVDLRFGGSVSKNTYVNGLSDVDALVLIHRDDVGNKSPSEIRALLADCLRSRFGRDKVREGDLAVTLSISDNEIQLLPAIQGNRGYKIKSTRGDEWSSIRPRSFSTKLTAANRRMDGKLVPTIKLAKAIIAKLPDQRQLSGYHTEVLAVSIFDGYDGPKATKPMLRYFFDSLPSAIRTPRRDVTGQSVYLDDYLGSRDSPQRRVTADAIDTVARTIRNADGAQSVPMWRELLTLE
jgi:hypothetical protein